MKKLLALALAAALALSLAACGGGSGAGSGSTSSVPDKEELLAEAQNIRLRDIFSTYDENKLNAEDTYIGNTYQIFGYVKNIEEEYCELEAAYYGSEKRLSKVAKVYLERDVLKELHTGEGIHIAGTIGSIDSSGITMETACYVDNETIGIFMAQYINKDNCNGKTIAIIDNCDGTYDRGSLVHTVYLNSTDLSSLHTDDFILASGIAYVEPKEGSFPPSYHYTLKDAKVLIQGADEITEFLDSIENG